MSNRVRAVIIHDNQLFLVHGKTRDYWALPGGHMKRGETVQEALRRELLEELGIEAVIGELLFICQFRAVDGYENPEFLLRVTNAADFIAADIAATSHGQLELTEAGFMDPATVKVQPEFLRDMVRLQAACETELVIEA